MRPLVGITAYSEVARFSYWETRAAIVPWAYVRAVERAGGRPLSLPPMDDAVEETLDALDGLVLSGGSDIDPVHYGSDAHPETTGTRTERDRAELALLEGALARDMPVLAICRGLQVLNVARGGDLVQHLPEALGSERHRETPGVFSEHDVAIAPGSRLCAILGERSPIRSHHHQGARRLGEGLEAVAWAEDGTVEGLEAPSQRFAVAVQWHPEEGEDTALFEALVAEAEGYRRERGAPISRPRAAAGARRGPHD